MTALLIRRTHVVGATVPPTAMLEASVATVQRLFRRTIKRLPEQPLQKRGSRVLNQSLLEAIQVVGQRLIFW